MELKKEIIYYWLKRFLSSLSILSFIEISLVIILYHFICSLQPVAAPTNALIRWIIILPICQILLYLLSKIEHKNNVRNCLNSNEPSIPNRDIASDRIQLMDKIKKTQNMFLFISIIIYGVATIVPSLWYFIFSTIVYTIEDGFLGFLILSFTSTGFILAIYLLHRKSSFLYIFLYNLAHLVVFSIFNLLEPLWLIITLPALINTKIIFELASDSRKFFPRFKTKQAKRIVVFGLILLMIPIGSLIFIFNHTKTYTLGTEKVSPIIELNFTWANATPLSEDAYNNLVYADSLPNIEISLTLPLIYRLKGDYGNKRTYLGEENVSWDLHLMVENDFQEIEEVDIKDVGKLNYVQNGLIENFTKNLTAAGIEVDFMPLLPKEVYFMYINDITIQSFYKYWAISKEYINRTGLGKLHRGIIIDTERDYSKFDQVLARWFDSSFHKKGTELLDQLLDEIRRDEVYWKMNYTYEEVKAMSISEVREKFQALVDNKTTHLSCATFQYHLDDFIDFDDKQQNLYEISVIPPLSWDYVGVMTYDKGINSEHNFYGYCRAIDRFFGERGVPYLYSEDSKQNIINKFRIAQNYGYSFIGMWALTSEYCYENWNVTGDWCGGFCDRFGWNALAELADALSNPEPIVFQFDGKNWYIWTWMHLLQLIDLYLIGPAVLPQFPLHGAKHIRL